MTYKPDQSFHAVIPNTDRPTKIHIMYVLDGVYEDEKLIVYRHFGKYRRWWHQLMCTDKQMDSYVEHVKDFKK